jgi:hypothetical protein
MLKRSHRIGFLATAFLAAAVLASTAHAGGPVMRCSGGANSGDACTTDADCPGLCLHNAGHDTTCGLDSRCPRVCRGGDTPGAECPDGICHGSCVGGENRGNPCTGIESCPGGYCNTECAADKCKLAFCKTGGGHSDSEPLRTGLEGSESWTDDSALSACAAEVE